MKKFFLVLGFLVVSVLFSIAQSPQTGQMYLSVFNKEQQLFCGVDNIDLEIENGHIKLDTSKGSLDLTVYEISSEYKQFLCQDVSGAKYTVQYMINKQSGGTGYIFVPDDEYRFTFFIGTTPVCDGK